MRYKTFKREALYNQCRECINGSYGLGLTPDNCRYLPYPGPCSCCGEVRNIVIGIAPMSRWKIWLLKTE